MRILNLYCGCGGNRKLWEDVEVVAVERDPEIAKIYRHYYPGDEIVIGDAHQFLLENYKNFDFIWSSPPCPSHSRIREMGVKNCLYPAIYPDIKLWEEITLLKHFAKNIYWVIENVIPYYEPIIKPTFKLDRHCFWSNFYVPKGIFAGRGVAHKNINGSNHQIFGFDISGFKVKDKRRVLRNMVNPEVGKHILETAMMRCSRKTQLKQAEMFV